MEPLSEILGVSEDTTLESSLKIAAVTLHAQCWCCMTTIHLHGTSSSQCPLTVWTADNLILLLLCSVDDGL